ncbi:MAG: hypothetical protein AMJ91_01190 [candidate division Zixibacteria bacterium SM23_73_3]|nr:MAG: hypothetical protein AMJ91_01190 [candidate division Zixibacteria bacterium SM23_73_3]
MRYRRIDKKSFHFDIYFNYEAMTSSLLERQTKVWSGSAAVFGTGLIATAIPNFLRRQGKLGGMDS